MSRSVGSRAFHRRGRGPTGAVPLARTAVAAAMFVAMIMVLAAGCGSSATTTSPNGTGTTSGSRPPGTDRGHPWTGRTTHLSITPADTRWTYANTDGSVQASGSTAAGFELPVDVVARDYWVWVDLTEHMEGVGEDADGLTQAGAGCGVAQCIHVVILPDGSVHLPNRYDRTVTELAFVFWSIHDAPAPKDDLPRDAPPLDERGNKVDVPRKPVHLPVHVTMDSSGTATTTTGTTAPLPGSAEYARAHPPQVIVSLADDNGRHVADIDPAGTDGFDLDPSDPATPPGTYWVVNRMYSVEGTWQTTRDNDGLDHADRGVVVHSAMCETDGCVKVELKADGSVVLAADAHSVTAIEFGIAPKHYPVQTNSTPGPPVVAPAPTNDEIAAPPGSVVLELRSGAPGQADAPGLLGYGAELSSRLGTPGTDEAGATVNRLARVDASVGAHTFVFTDVPSDLYHLQVLESGGTPASGFRTRDGSEVRYGGLAVPVPGGPAMYVTLWYGSPTPPSTPPVS